MRVLLDSGAFSLWQSGAGTLQLDPYIDFIKCYRSRLYACVNLDVITKRDEWRQSGFERSAAASYDHLSQMRSELLPLGVDPFGVFHAFEPIRYLELMLRDGVKRIALACKEPPRVKFAWLDTCFEVLKDQDVQLHGLAFTDQRILKRYPFASVDSTSWLSKYGTILVPTYDVDGRPNYLLPPQTVSVTEGSTMSSNHIERAPSLILRDVYQRLAEIGINLSELHDHEARQRVNLRWFQDLERTTKSTIFFVSNIQPGQSTLLRRCGIDNRLLSFFHLRRQSPDSIERYFGEHVFG
jgi:hypothetical protein